MAKNDTKSKILFIVYTFTQSSLVFTKQTQQLKTSNTFKHIRLFEQISVPVDVRVFEITVLTSGGIRVAFMKFKCHFLCISRNIL